MAEQGAFPVPADKLEEFTTKACTAALSSSSEYDHSQVSDWNTTIIQSLLSSLTAAVAPHSYKFSVTSTVIQHDVGAGANGPSRGMHSASGAYWNVERDGQWSFKYEGGGERGFDVVVSVVWVGA